VLAAAVAFKLHQRHVADPRALRTLPETLVRISDAQRTHYLLEGAYTDDLDALAARDPRLAELLRDRPWKRRGSLGLHLEDEAGRAFSATALAAPYGPGMWRTFLLARGQDGLRWYDAGNERDRDRLPISPDDPPEHPIEAP
jgi:hypothetical protein